MSSRGRFISLEGGEGGGKGVQSRLFAEALHKKGIEAVITRNPGGTPGAELIRSLLVTGEPDRWDRVSELLLFLAARRDNLQRVVWPALEKGQWVISDRFHDSSVAYQGYGMGIDLNLIAQLKKLSLGDVNPDLTIILDIPVDKGVARSIDRHSDARRHEKMDLSFHEKVRQGYLKIAQQEPQRCIVINAEQTIEKIHQDIWNIVEQRFFKAAAA